MRVKHERTAMLSVTAQICFKLRSAMMTAFLANKATWEASGDHTTYLQTQGP